MNRINRLIRINIVMAAIARWHMLVGLTFMVLVFMILASCSSLGFGDPGVDGLAAQGNGIFGDDGAFEGAEGEVRQQLVSMAREILGAEELRIAGREFRIDCTGVVQALYWGAGIDLVGPLSRYSGNGVARLYAFLDEMELLKGGVNPLPGDLVFWDDTYDKNENGKVDDPFTHVGMVVSIDSAGNLEYIHHNYRKGIVLEWMNPRTPSVYTRVEDGKTVIVNSPMRMRGSPEYDKTLSGELVRSWAEPWRL